MAKVERRALPPSERDLLIRLSERFDNQAGTIEEIKSDIKTIKDDTLHRVEKLDQEKADKLQIEKLILESDKTHDEMRTEMDAMKSKIIFAYGAIALAGFVIPLIVLYIKK